MLILTVLQGPDRGRRFELPDDEPQLIGRSSEALPITDRSISRRHAELTPDHGKWYLRDIQSANGTFVNGTRVTERRLLQLGDQIRTGNTILVFGTENRTPRSHGVRVAKKGEIESVLEHTAPANDDSMILAVAEPSEAAVVQLKVIYEMTQIIGSTVEQQQLLERVMDLIFEYFKADRGFILLFRDGEERPDPVVVRHRVKPPKKEDAQISVSRTIVHHVVKHHEGVLSSDAMTDSRFAGGDSVQRYGIRSAMCAPIKYKEQIFGVIQIDSKIANYTFTEDQLRLLTAISVHTGLAMANAALYADRLQQERLAAIGQTVASLSHSIKNILQGLRGGADVVELGLRKDNMKVVRGGWEIVARNLERIFGLTMNMLAYSTNRRPELEMVNLKKLLEETKSLVQSQYDVKKVGLMVDVDSDLPPVPVDQSGLHQAMVNLLNNALDACEPELGLVIISADFDEETQRVRIKVTDNGAGIEAERAKRLFQPFQSSKGYKGTGLGLVVTRKVVEEHGGTIEVDSKPGQGSTFMIFLPTNVEAIPASAETQHPAERSTLIEDFGLAEKAKPGKEKPKRGG